MLKNYLTIAWRHLFRNRTLSFINIIGLSVGMAFAMLIGMWIQYERSFDAFHENKDRIAIVRKHTLFNHQKSTQLSVMLPLYDELKNNYPEVKHASRIDWGNEHSLMVGDSKFNKNGHYVDPDFLKMFTFPVVRGNAENPLQDPHSIVLTESLAKTLFGADDPIGKVIKLDNKYQVKVTALVKDVPKNSSYSFDFLAPFEFKVQAFDFIRKARTEWTNNFLMTAVEVKEGVSMEDLSRKIGPLVVQKDKQLKNQTLFLQPLMDWHLFNDFKDWKRVGGRIEYIRLFGIIGGFVLLIACINFMNLSTARSEKRAKEVGIRKAVGSRRRQLIAQFLIESVFTSFLAFLVSLMLIQVLLPFLKDLGFEHIHFDYRNATLMASVLGVCILTGLISGSFPALYLSSFLPVDVLKGVIKQGQRTVNFRKVLVVSQFIISISLIICTVIIFKQVQHGRNRSIGYDPDNVITLAANDDLAINYNPLKQELLNTGYVEAVAKSSSPLTQVFNDWSDFRWEGKDPNVDMSMEVLMTEWDFEKVARLKFIEGRPFSRQFKTDTNAVILNESALNTIGFKNPIGKTIKLGEQTLTIVGVIENVVMRNPFKPVSPGVILFNAQNVSVVLLRLKSGADLSKALASIRPIVEKYNPSLPFEYSFVDDDFEKKFRMENQVAKLAGIFAGLAIFISCLGLFGLAMFLAERRSREISIRKVLGASVAHLWALLSKEFILLVLIACLIASPLALWMMSEWLEKYEYRIRIHWGIFVGAGMVAILIAIITVSAQAIKAAIANPVKNLRSE